MAETKEEKKKNKEQAKKEKQEKKEQAKKEKGKEGKEGKEEKQKDQPDGKKTGILTWAVMAAIILILAGSGFFLGNLLAGSSSSETAEVSDELVLNKDLASQKEAEKSAKSGDSGDNWFYDELPAVVVNPDVPGATRYVRAGFILEISSELDYGVDGPALIIDKTPILINWLNLYFKSLTLEQMKNEKDMKRILAQVLDSFNEILFPDSKPLIKKILIREFNVQ